MLAADVEDRILKLPPKLWIGRTSVCSKCGLSTLWVAAGRNSGDRRIECVRCSSRGFVSRTGQAHAETTIWLRSNGYQGEIITD